jgi:uncharacterized protein
MVSTRTRIVELNEQECHERMSSHHPRLGRVAFAEDGNPQWPTVLPVNYAYHDGRILFRTFEGSKLYAALRRQRVAFEVDAVEPGWEQGWSVVVVGVLELVTDSSERAAAEAVLRSWAVDASEHVVRLDIAHLTGRQLIGPPATA